MQNCRFSIDLLIEGSVSSATECPFYKVKPRNKLKAGDCVSRLLADARFLTLANPRCTLGNPLYALYTGVYARAAVALFFNMDA